MMRLIFTLFTTLASLCLFAQGMLPGDIPSPNASDLGRYGDVPVSFYTGRPQITIPLYEFSLRGVTLPIVLSYDAGGVLMNSLPGWTGHNWTLQAGGCITRVMHGRPDEIVLPTSIGTSYSLFDRSRNYFNVHSQLQADRFGANETCEWLKDSLRTQLYDYSADVFYFNVMGLSGRFFLGNDGQWKVLSDSNIEVLFDISDANNYILPFLDEYPFEGTNEKQPKTIRGFVLRDENGTTYRFGGSSDYIEYTIGLCNMCDKEAQSSWMANSWYLKSVEDRYGNTLYEFLYSRGTYILYLANAYQSITYGNHFVYKHLHIPIFYLHTQYDGLFSNSDFPYTGSLIAPIYLTEISMCDGTGVSFISENCDESMSECYQLNEAFYNGAKETIGQMINHNPNQFYTVELPFYYLQTEDCPASDYQRYAGKWEKRANPLLTCSLRRLDDIEISLTNGGHDGRCYHLEYDFSSRMHLTSVNVYDYEDDDVHYSYKLKYKDFDKLPPDYLTKEVDYWGYYSTASGRSPVWNCSMSGMLTEIEYPTGGVSEFEYEQNTYSQYMSDDKQQMLSESEVAGGLRIKRITEYNSTTKQQVLRERTYNYSIPGTQQSSGELYAKPRTDWVYYPKLEVGSSPYSSWEIHRDCSVIPLANSFGTHIGYSYVRETEKDGTSTVYHYTNFSDAREDTMVKHFSESLPTPFDRYGDKGYRRGRLLSVAVYGDGGLMKKTTYTYRTDNPEKWYVLTSNVEPSNTSPNPTFLFYTGGVYKLFYPKYDVVDIVTVNYSSGREMKDSVHYIKSDNYNLSMNSPYVHQAAIRYTTEERHLRGTDIFATSYGWQFNTTELSSRLAKEQFYLRPIDVVKKYNTKEISKSRTEYVQQSNRIFPKYELEWKFGTEKADTLVTYLGYSDTGQLTKYQEMGMPVTTLTWTGNDCHLQSKSIGGQTTLYGYAPNFQLASVTLPNGNTTNYQYDVVGRLADILDKDGNLIQHFDYLCNGKK